VSSRLTPPTVTIRIRGFDGAFVVHTTVDVLAGLAYMKSATGFVGKKPKVDKFDNV
jgi:hypothetical protein